MSLIARALYGALVWKERQHAKRARQAPPAELTSEGGDQHLETGARGETLVYWYLRRSGYTMVARNLRLGGGAGELDLVGWDGPVLAFIEVKTRASDAAGQPEEAVTRAQRKRIVRAAREYLRRLPPTSKPASYRFDMASVFWNPQQGFQVRVVKDAFRD